MKRRPALVLVVCLALAIACGTAWSAPKYPEKPVTFVVPWGAGGMTDVSARLLAEKFKAEFKEPVLVV
ncbi:MAG TPA: tripartite tricarboxylate transporter substrate binding protein, partial [Thermodesulfobacteriota bacterium]|nr:tripartite tricarboxylate transporter substrate binding protein [Thermodesulfobacteriota bacterium]